MRNMVAFAVYKKKNYVYKSSGQIGTYSEI